MPRTTPLNGRSATPSPESSPEAPRRSPQNPGNAWGIQVTPENSPGVRDARAPLRQARERHARTNAGVSAATLQSMHSAAQQNPIAAAAARLRHVLQSEEEAPQEVSTGPVRDHSVRRLIENYTDRSEASITAFDARVQQRIGQLRSNIDAALQELREANEEFQRPFQPDIQSQAVRRNLAAQFDAVGLMPPSSSIRPEYRSTLSIPAGFDARKYDSMIKRVDLLSQAERATRLEYLVNKIIFIKLDDGEPEQALLDAGHEVRLLEANLPADVIKRAKELAEKE